MKKQFLLFIFYSLPFMTFAQVFINEVCSDNATTILDEFGETPDWIELYNSGNSAVNLNGYFLSDNESDPQKWTFPNISIPANDYLLIFASEEDLFSTYAHTNFKLSKDGEELLFSDTNGDLIDQIVIPPLEEDNSYGRLTSNLEWAYFDMTTPGSENNDSGSFQFNNKPTFEIAQVFHDDLVEVELTCDAPNCLIRFTTDGSVPSETSTLYTGPILSDTTISIRARTFSDNRLPSLPSTKTYFINTNHQFPIVSLTTDPVLLYDWENGIFEMGPDADTIFPYFGANFWKNITIPLHFEYFRNQELVLNQDTGTKIHGGKTSRTRIMKSLQLIADYEYGEKNRFDYPFFDNKDIDSYKRIVLRNASGDFNFTHCRDGYMHRHLINEGLDIDMLAYQPVVAYLNGVYWGVINLREKVTDFYLKENHDEIAIKEVDLLEEDSFVIEGSMEIFDEMLGELENSDITDNANLALAEENFDFNNLMDYFITETALCNSDWPGNNVKYWRERKDGSKWRYILVDLDAAMGRAGFTQADANYLHNFFNLERLQGIKLVRLFKKLVENISFRNNFLNRYADLLNTTFRSTTMTAQAEQIEAELDEEIFLHFQKWTWPGYDVWKSNRLQTLYDFARDRPPFARQYLIEEFNLSNEVNLELNVYPPGAGLIKINTIQPESLPWRGHYFNGVPVTLTIVPNPGFTFKHWESIHSIVDPNTSIQITQNFERDDAITAFFEGAEVPFAIGLSPNPTDNQINLSFILAEISEVIVNIYDISGKKIQANNFGRLGAGQKRLAIDLSSYAKGVYLIEAIADGNRSVEKVFKSSE